MTSPTSTTTFAGRVRNLANLHKPHIDINLNGNSHVIRAFSTFDKIEGNVAITAPFDTAFDSVEISLIGTTRSFVDKMATVSAVNGRREAFQQFLKLEQPLSQTDYPDPPVFSQDKTYTFPFNFVVPEHLLLTACRHKTNNPKIKDAHMQLPPSMGDPEMAGFGSTLKDDMAPAMARVQYGLRVRVIRSRDRDQKEMILAARTRKICIIPASEEQPPVTFDAREDEYCTRKEKSIKKGVFKGKMGRLAMEALQPKSLRLPPPSTTVSAPENVTTTATINLRFDPVDAQVQPPRLNSLSSKLKVATFYSSGPRPDFPAKSHAVYDGAQGLYVEVIPLSQRCMASVPWEKHDAPASRRDSAVSLDAPAYEDDVPQPTSASDVQAPFYTAKLLVPITLPTSKAFLPTFHSCLVSRIYVLELALSVPALGVGPNSSMTLKVPVQISVASGNEALSRRASDAAAIEDQLQASPEMEYFQPRRVSSMAAAAPPPPPDYTFLPTARTGRAPSSAWVAEAPAYTAIR